DCCTGFWYRGVRAFDKNHGATFHDRDRNSLPAPLPHQGRAPQTQQPASQQSPWRGPPEMSRSQGDKRLTVGSVPQGVRPENVAVLRVSGLRRTTGSEKNGGLG